MKLHSTNARLSPLPHRVHGFGGNAADSGKMAASKADAQADPEHVNPVPEEMSLPSAAIQRIIKSKLPEGVMIGKEAKVAFSKASSIFILYVTTMCALRPMRAPSRRALAPADPPAPQR